MKMEDMILISTDDHICEPPTIFDNYKGKYKDQMPLVVSRDGIDAWEFNGKRAPNLALNAVVGRRPEEYGLEPKAFSELRKGCYDVKARLDDMNINGVLASLNFNQFTGHGAQAFICDDTELSNTIVSAYNDWHIDEWCAYAPDRFIPNVIMPHWSVEACAAEAIRVHEKGCHAISMLPTPNREGFPSWNSGYWDPLLQVCNDRGIVINTHINDATIATPSPESTVDVFITNMPVTLFVTAADILWSHIPKKFPNLRFSLAEGSAGWIPHLKERADFTFHHHGAWTHSGQAMPDGMLPSEVFDRMFINCFIFDRTAIKNRDDVGIDNMTWECDYPHSDCTWPKSPETLFPQFEGCTDEEINKITHLNAMKAFNFDPFKHTDRKDATVGALRAQAPTEDLTYLEGGGIKGYDEGKRPTMGELAQRMAEAYSSESWIGEVESRVK